MKTLILLLCLFYSISSVVADTAANFKKVRGLYKETMSQFSNVPTLKIAEFVKNKVKTPNQIILVDVRPLKERKVSIIPGAISKNEYWANRKKYKDKVLVAYCTIGHRSAEFIQKMKKLGIKGYNLEYSMLGWVHVQKQIVKKDGSLTKEMHVYGSKWNLLPEGYVGLY